VAATPLDPTKRPRTRSSAPLSPEQDDNWRFYVAMTPKVQTKSRNSSVSDAAVSASARQASPELQAPAEQGEMSPRPPRDAGLTSYLLTYVSPNRTTTSSTAEAVPALPTPPATPLVAIAAPSPSPSSSASQAEGEESLRLVLYSPADYSPSAPAPRLSRYEQLRAEIASREKRTSKPSTKLKESLESPSTPLLTSEVYFPLTESTFD